MSPLLVVDVQPAYFSGMSPRLPGQILSHLADNPSQLVVFLSVNEELSGDTEESIQEFWADHGLDEDLASRIRFETKPYAFLRSWMDQGVDEDEIVETCRALRRAGLNDSRELPTDALEGLSCEGTALGDPLILPKELDDIRFFRTGMQLDICGGGRYECLKEMELWLAARDITCERLEHLVY